jgi:hypothetical protein
MVSHLAMGWFVTGKIIKAHTFLKQKKSLFALVV